MNTEIITSWSKTALHSLQVMMEKIASVLPNIIGALLILLIGWIVARIVKYLLQKTLRFISFDKLMKYMVEDDVLVKIENKLTLSQIVGKFTYWLIILLSFILASDILGWHNVSEELGNILMYIPKLFSGLLIFGAGLYIAGFVRKLIHTLTGSLGIDAGRFLGNAAYYVIIIFLTIAAINQIGIKTDILSANLTIVIASVMFAFALSFGLASKEILQSIIGGIYSKNKFKIGQKIEVDGVNGIIIEVDRISVTLETENGSIVVPMKELTNKMIYINK